jgi:hypothetical protein
MVTQNPEHVAFGGRSDQAANSGDRITGND